MQMSETKKKGRLPEFIRKRAEDLLLEGDSVHQVWRRTNVSKPKLGEMRDELVSEGKLIIPGRIIRGNGKRFGK